MPEIPASSSAQQVRLEFTADLMVDSGFTFTLEVPHYECTLGEHLALVGNIRVLGAWNVERAVALEWREGHSWVGSVSVPGSCGRGVPVVAARPPPLPPCGHIAAVNVESR